MLRGISELSCVYFMPYETHVGPDLRRRNCGQVAHTHQIVGCASESEDPMHFADSAMPNLPHQRDLQPRQESRQALKDVRRGNLTKTTVTKIAARPRGTRQGQAAPSASLHTDATECNAVWDGCVRKRFTPRCVPRMLPKLPAGGCDGHHTVKYR
jgi:hypothetical protein